MTNVRKGQIRFPMQTGRRCILKHVDRKTKRLKEHFSLTSSRGTSQSISCTQMSLSSLFPRGNDLRPRQIPPSSTIQHSPLQSPWIPGLPVVGIKPLLAQEPVG